MPETLEKQLSDWRNWWRKWLLQLNVLGAMLMHFVLSNPNFVTDITRQLPPSLQPSVPWIAPTLWLVVYQVLKTVEDRRRKAELTGGV